MKKLKKHKFLLVLILVIAVSVMILLGLFLFGKTTSDSISWTTGGDDTIAPYRIRLLSDNKIELGFNTSNLSDKEITCGDVSNESYSVSDSGISGNYHTFIITPGSGSFNLTFKIYSSDDYSRMTSDSEYLNALEAGTLTERISPLYFFNVFVIVDSNGNATIRDIYCHDYESVSADYESYFQTTTFNNCTITYPECDSLHDDRQSIIIEGGNKDEWQVTGDNINASYTYSDSDIRVEISAENTDDYESEITLIHKASDTETTVLTLKLTCSYGIIISIEKM